MTRLRVAALVLAALPFMVALAARAEDPRAGSRSLYQIEGAWTDQNSRPFALASLRGGAVVLALFYGTCDSVCPSVVRDMKMLEALLPEADRARTRFVLVTIDPAMDTPSYTENADDPFLSRSEMKSYWAHYIGDSAPGGLAAPGLTPDLAGLPPAYVLVAGRDVLRDEGVAYAASCCAPPGWTRRVRASPSWPLRCGAGSTRQAAHDPVRRHRGRTWLQIVDVQVRHRGDRHHEQRSRRPGRHDGQRGGVPLA